MPQTNLMVDLKSNASRVMGSFGQHLSYCWQAPGKLAESYGVPKSVVSVARWLMPSALISGALGLEQTLLAYGHEPVSALTTLADFTGASGAVAREQFKGTLPVAAAMATALQVGYGLSCVYGAAGDVIGEIEW